MCFIVLIFLPHKLKGYNSEKLPATDELKTTNIGPNPIPSVLGLCHVQRKCFQNYLHIAKLIFKICGSFSHYQIPPASMQTERTGYSFEISMGNLNM